MSTPLYMGFDLSTQSLSCTIVSSAKIVYQRSIKFADVLKTSTSPALPGSPTPTSDIVNMTNVDDATRAHTSLMSDSEAKGCIATQSVGLFLVAYDMLLNEIRKDSKSWTSHSLEDVVGFSASGQQHGTIWWSDQSSKGAWGETFESLLESSQFSSPDASIWMDSSTNKEVAALCHNGFGKICQEITGSYPTARFSALQVAKVRRIGNFGRTTTKCATCDETAGNIATNTKKVELISAFATNIMSDCNISDHPCADYSDGSGMNILDVNNPSKGYDERITEILDSVTCDGKRATPTHIPSVNKLMSPPPVLSTARMGNNLSNLFASKLGVSPINKHVIIGTGDNPATIAGVNLTNPGADILISLGTSDTLMGVCANLPSPYSTDVGHYFVNPCCNDESSLNYFAMICFSNGGRTRERLCDTLVAKEKGWGGFDELLGVSDTDGSSAGVSKLAGNGGKLSMHIDVSETVPLINKVGCYKANLKQGTSILTGHEEWSEGEEVRAAVQGRIMSMRVNAGKMGLLEDSNVRRRIIVVGGGSNSKGINQIIADVFRGDVLISGAPDSKAQLNGSDFFEVNSSVSVNTASLGAACRAMHGTVNPEAAYGSVCGEIIDSSLKVVASYDSDASDSYDNWLADFEKFEQAVVENSRNC